VSHLFRYRIVTRFFFPAAFLAGIAASQNKEITNPIGMRLIRIDPGTFTMGFTGEPLSTGVAVRPWRVNDDFDKHPAHPVRITKAFYMGDFDVTNAQL
jgi:formylglycine-generating enzyme required for sulfatase activity